ncbi:MAG: hypothetical protein E6J29_10625 [Chloroflexi bacterium]|nr:MAG: hypothetical protein E6J29_10625 [Chloroflexota bacterium]TMD55836.1 MAG: hypothetical protein E6I85_02025 [Chloroflexota bacterium]
MRISWCLPYRPDSAPRDAGSALVALAPAIANFATSKEPTIGDTGGAYHGQFWVSAYVGGHSVRIAADTTREAVQRVVDAVGYDPKLPWRVIGNQRGRVNKLVIGDRAEPGWFAYLTKPLSAEATI